MAYTEFKNISGIGTQNITLTAGTYFLSSIVNLENYKLTFDCSNGNIIVKRESNFYFTNVGEINTVNSSEINKVYWTNKNDDTIGDIISGSTGTPVVTSNGINRGVAISAPGTFKYWEIRWMGVHYMTNGSDPYNGYIFNFIGQYTRTFQNIIFKNCYFATVKVFMGTYYLPFKIFNIINGTTNFEYIDFDDTNIVPFRENLYGGNSIYFASITSLINIHDIFATNFFSNVPFLTLNYTSQLNVDQPDEIKNINIKGTQGFSISTKNNTNLENICVGTVEIKSNDIYVNHNINFKNCIFDHDFSSTNSLVGIYSESYSSILNFNHCIFKNWKKYYKPNNSYIWDGRVFDGKELKINVNNSVFVNNYYLTSGTSTSSLQKTGDYNCFYNNSYRDLGFSDFGQAGTHDLNINPGLTSAPIGCVINSNFSKYIPDGNFISNIDKLQGKGSDTFDNLSIDENLYTATGYKYLGTHYITPGINYLVDVFYSNVSYAFELDTFEALTNLHKVDAKYFNVPQRQIIAIENELGINPKGSMSDLKTRLAVSLNDDGTLKVSVPGETGLQGVTGIQGIQGNLGIQGIKGESGIQGIQGEIGLQGIQGDLGIQGIQGQTGPEGDFLIKKKNITVSSIDGTFNFIFSEQGFLDYFNSNYKVYLTPIGVNATKCWAVVSGSKTTSGFTISCVVAGTNGTSPYNATENGGGNINIDVITVPV